MLVGVQSVRPTGPPMTAMTVAARELPAGTRLTAADLATIQVPPGTVPDGSLSDDLDGRVLASPMRRGEPVTDLRLVGPGLTVDAPGLVAVPVRLPDAEMAGLLRVGDHVRLLATGAADGGVTRVVAPDARILALPGAADGASGDGAGAATSSTTGNGVMTGPGGRLIVVGLPEELVATVTAASVRDFLTFAYPN